jgi:hypothetical protein
VAEAFAQIAGNIKDLTTATMAQASEKTSDAAIADSRADNPAVDIDLEIENSDELTTEQVSEKLAQIFDEPSQQDSESIIAEAVNLTVPSEQPKAVACEKESIAPSYVAEPLIIDVKELDFVKGFVEEAREHIEAIEAAVLEVEQEEVGAPVAEHVSDAGCGELEHQVADGYDVGGDELTEGHDGSIANMSTGMIGWDRGDRQPSDAGSVDPA